MPGKTGRTLMHQHEMSVRFSEVDSMGIVWHGHYLQYFEEARESFGKAYQIGYMFIHTHGYQIPVVEMQTKYLCPIRYEDKISIETTFIDTLAAKIIFQYQIFNLTENKIVCRAESTQVFIDAEGRLMLNSPAFFLDWKQQNGLLS